MHIGFVMITGFLWALKAQKRLHNTVKGPRKLKNPGLIPLQLGVDEGRVYWGQTSHLQLGKQP